jgi:hypothetical protein
MVRHIMDSPPQLLLPALVGPAGRPVRAGGDDHIGTYSESATAQLNKTKTPGLGDRRIHFRDSFGYTRHAATSTGTEGSEVPLRASLGRICHLWFACVCPVGPSNSSVRFFLRTYARLVITVSFKFLNCLYPN